MDTTLDDDLISVEQNDMIDEEETDKLATQPNHQSIEAHHPTDINQTQLHQAMTDNSMVHGAGGGC